MILAAVILALVASSQCSLVGQAQAQAVPQHEVQAVRRADIQCLVENTIMGVGALVRDWVWGVVDVAYTAGESAVELAQCLAGGDTDKLLCLRQGYVRASQLVGKIVDLVVGRAVAALDYAKEALKCLQQQQRVASATPQHWPLLS